MCGDGIKGGELEAERKKIRGWRNVLKFIEKIGKLELIINREKEKMNVM